MKLQRTDTGSTIICALSTIFIVSLIGATVLLNCAARYNVATKQVKGWKESLYAAEAGGDVAFAEIRKVLSTGSTFNSTFVGDGWTASAAPTPGPAYVKAVAAFGQSNSLSASVTADKFYTDSGGSDYYRIRSAGTAKLLGLPRTGLDSALTAGGTHFATQSTTNSTARGNGDTLLRKIDFTYDHFKTTYGDGDMNNLSSATVSNPQITRRIELIAAPQFAFTGALKATGSFNGPGSAGLIDSYDSKNGAYSFVANNPASPLYKYSQEGDVSVATSSFTEGGAIYGDLTTNGGNATSSNTNVSGTIDNNVPFTIPKLVRPDTTSYTSGNGTTLDLSAVATPPTSWAQSAHYYYSSLGNGLTISGLTVASGLPNAGKPAESYVIIVVGSAGATTGSIAKTITIGAGVNAKIYFTGDLTTKATNINNNNVDGATGIYNADGSPSTDYSRAGHLQFYGISPTDGTNETITIGPPGDLYATFYAPDDNFTMTGNPQVYGAIVAHNFSGNGNTGFHYDMEIASLGGIPIDYQIVSYVEDTR
jgi:hypothetical protein